ncbi:MAG: hypothetical protein H0U74_13880 [Bradymonadaceae bacterium]|nr:hypothetical protein [Lujinxingiaceae bacterium]
MTRLRSCLTLFLALLLSSALIVPATVLAFDDDEMSFDAEDVEPVGENDMTFAPGDAKRNKAGSAEKLGVAVVAIPSPDLDETDRVAIQNELRSAMDTVPGFVSYGDNTVLPGLEDRDPMSCVREPLCLASVGRSAGVERILSARITRTGGSYRLDVDFFDVNERLFLRYHSAADLSNMSAVVKAIRPAVNDIFHIRGPRGPDGYVDDDSVNLNRILAYSTAGLSAVCLGVGIYFGMQVNSLEEEFNAQAKTGERYTSLTQVDAQRRIRDMESTAVTANIFFGLSAALGVGSILLFIIEGDSADEDLASIERPWQNVRVAPTISRDGLGLGAHLRF